MSFVFNFAPLGIPPEKVGLEAAFIAREEQEAGRTVQENIEQNFAFFLLVLF